jgi:hypothetical protein
VRLNLRLRELFGEAPRERPNVATANVLREHDRSRAIVTEPHGCCEGAAKDVPGRAIVNGAVPVTEVTR